MHAENKEGLPEGEIAVKDFEPLRREFDFDPTCGYTLEDLLKIEVTEEAPADFDAFWMKAHAANEQIPLGLEFRPSAFGTETHEVREIYFNVSHGFRAGGWICEPVAKNLLRRVEIFSHGYGGRAAPEVGFLTADAVQIFMCAPGFNLSAAANRVASNSKPAHVLCGIDSRENYILGPSAATWWSAARVAEMLFPAMPIVYRGGSFGGGIGALLLPWEKRYVAAELNQPTFGFHTFRLAHYSTGCAETVRQAWQQQPGIRQTLRYFDALYAARRITIPVVIGVCAFDPNVAPPGQFAVARAIPERFRKISLFSCGHCNFDYPGSRLEGERHEAKVREVFSRQLQ